MFKLPKAAVAGLALSLSAFAALISINPAQALAVIIFSPPESKPAPVSDKRLAEIAKYDVIVFIDSSRSMSRTVGPEKAWYLPTPVAFPADVPSTQSRWQWCSQQTETLSKQLQNVPKEHLTDHLKVVLFNKKSTEHKDVDLSSVPTFFAKNSPAGDTNTASALKLQLQKYFANRDRGGEARPLLVAMITDGCPDDQFSLRQTIIEATKKMRSADEVAITFLQVGVDPNATRYLRELDHGLTDSHARYDIVTSKSFEEVNKTGLAEALLEAVHK